MKTLNLLISSKNKKSLDNFLKIFNEKFSIIDSTFIKKNYQKKLKKTVITILKSPHVNKTAQEQFEIRYLSRQIQIYTLRIFKFLIFLKKLKIYLFPSIHIKIKIVHNKKQTTLINKRIFNLDNYRYRLLFLTNSNKIQNHKVKKNKLKLLKKTCEATIKSVDTQKILKLLDTYGKY